MLLQCLPVYGLALPWRRYGAFQRCLPGGLCLDAGPQRLLDYGDQRDRAWCRATGHHRGGELTGIVVDAHAGELLSVCIHAHNHRAATVTELHQVMRVTT